MDRPFPLQQQWIGLQQAPWRPELGRHWRYLSIALIPALLLVVAFALAAKSSTKPSPAVAQPVQRSDKFEQRFPQDIGPVVRAVRTISIVPNPSTPLPPPPTPPVEEAAVDDMVRTPVPRPHIFTRRSRPREVKPRGDICQQHGRKKVMVSRYRWRCR